MTDTPLAGQLEDTPFAEVAGLLFRGKKTGILTVTSQKKERQVVFYEGHPVAVLSSDPKEHIARFLAVKGKISKEQAAKLQQVPETREGLQSSGELTKELLAWGLKFRFINLAYDLFRWPEGSYAFAEQPPPRNYFLMKVPTPSLLLKGIKHMPPSLLMEKIPGSYQVGSGSTAHEDLGPLGDEEATFLRECREGRLVREILESGDVEISRARELLFAFSSLGLLSLAPVTEEPAESELGPGGLEIEGLTLDEEEPATGAAAEEMSLEPDDAAAAGGAESAGSESPQDSLDTATPPEEEPGFDVGSREEETGVPEEPGPSGGEPTLELEDQRETPGDVPAEPGGALELELEPTSMAPQETPPGDEGPGFEIESHSYGEEPAAGEAAGTPSPEMDGPQPLDGPAPIGLEEEAPGLEPPPLEAPPVEGSLPPLDGGDAPADDSPEGETPGLPPPPWQEQGAGGTGADSGPPDSGLSPFAPPEAHEEPKAPRREKSAAQAPPAKKPSGPLAKVVTVIALVAAVGVVGAGVWMGWQNLQSPSTPLEPIPEAETVTDSEMAEDLPVPALPTSVKKAVKTTKAQGAPPAPAATPSSPAVAAAGGSDFYQNGYASYSRGDLAGAAAAWFADLKSAGFSHTIQVEVACKPDTVRNDVERFGRDRQVFAVPLTLKGDPCYRVLLGAFSSEAEAAAVLDGLPPSLKKGLSIRTLKGII